MAIVFVVAYIVLAPMLPLATFWFEQHATARPKQLASQLHLPLGQVAAAPGDNRLVVPAMLLNAPISEGKDLSALRNGPWRRPNGSTPDNGGNTVIVGHRFTYANPHGVFYNLNKVRLHDELGIFWQGKRYLYKVSSIATVPPTDTIIESPTADARLTLYTCAPLWLPKDRLVVIAELEQQS